VVKAIAPPTAVGQVLTSTDETNANPEWGTPLEVSVTSPATITRAGDGTVAEVVNGTVTTNQISRSAAGQVTSYRETVGGTSTTWTIARRLGQRDRSQLLSGAVILGGKLDAQAALAQDETLLSGAVRAVSGPIQRVPFSSSITTQVAGTSNSATQTGSPYLPPNPDGTGRMSRAAKRSSSRLAATIRCSPQARPLLRGATSIPVVSQTPTFAFPVGSGVAAIDNQHLNTFGMRWPRKSSPTTSRRPGRRWSNDQGFAYFSTSARIRPGTARRTPD
jgi:hypothetical protein